MCACSVIPFFGKLLKFGIFSEIGIRNYNFPKTVLYFKVEERNGILPTTVYYSSTLADTDSWSDNKITILLKAYIAMNYHKTYLITSSLIASCHFH